MSPRVDRALRVHPMVPCPVRYRQGMLEPPTGPAHHESASNRRTNIIPSAAATRQSRIHFGMVRVCIHPGHLHPRPPPTALSYRGSRQRPGSNPRLLDASRLLINTKSQRHSIVSPAPTDPGPGNDRVDRGPGQHVKPQQTVDRGLRSNTLLSRKGKKMTQLDFEMARSRANDCIRALDAVSKVNFVLHTLAPDLMPEVDKISAALVEKLVENQAIVNQGFPQIEASY